MTDWHDPALRSREAPGHGTHLHPGPLRSRRSLKSSPSPRPGFARRALRSPCWGDDKDFYHRNLRICRRLVPPLQGYAKEQSKWSSRILPGSAAVRGADMADSIGRDDWNVEPMNAPHRTPCTGAAAP